MFNNILVVCVGNICRSPIAEALLKQAFAEKNKSHCLIQSAGVGALVGQSPDPNACKLMLDRGIDISDYRACQINKDMIRQADLILVMESFQKVAVEKLEPCARGKVFRLGEWGEGEIPDPYQKNIAAFEKSLEMIESAVAKWIEKL